MTKQEPLDLTAEASQARALVLNVPHVFKDPSFVEWLNRDSTKFTWHGSGAPGDYSDVIVLVDPSLCGEGSDDDMPEHVWAGIIDVCRKYFVPSQFSNHIMVRLTNES